MHRSTRHQLTAAIFGLLLAPDIHGSSFGTFAVSSQGNVKGIEADSLAANTIGSAPPPLPPVEDAVPNRKESEDIKPSKAMARYQTCLDQMIDTKGAGPAFMRSCLGMGKSQTGPSTPNSATRWPAKAFLQSPSLHSKKVTDIPASMEFLDLHTVKTVLSSQTKKLKPCYSAYLNRRLKADAIHKNRQSESSDNKQASHGTVEAKFVIKADGTIRNLRLMLGSLKEQKFGRCLNAFISRWKFPKAISEDEVYVHHGIDFSRQSGKVMATIEHGYPATRGLIAIAPKDLIDAMNALNPSLNHCYESLLRRQSMAKGKVAMFLNIDANGQVIGVAYKAFQLGDGQFQDCLTKEASRWLLPRPKNGQMSNTIAWPLLFDPAAASRPPQLPRGQ